MKNLANCKPSEFLKQTNKIRKSVNKWLAVTDVMNIRKNMPNISRDDVSEDEYNKAIEEQVNKNVNEILNAMLDEHPTETLELLALLCFVEPDHVDDYTVSEYIDSLNELISNKAVIGFFTSLVKLGNLNI